MTIDEAIAHCLEVAEQNETSAITYKNCKEIKTNMYEKLTAEKAENDCRECAADHRQLAEWLTELKDSRAAQNEQEIFIHELMGELEEAKRLLKAAIEDVETLAKAFAEDEPCGSFTLCSECPLCIKEGCSCKEWRYKVEALKLIGGETDEKP